ncbi:MAG: DUF350 domain-containing protein [Thermoflexales bacterium]|nr:DUF350 domain-containing protein [Thermoflexales bacterium]
MAALFLSGAQLVISVITAALVAFLSIWLFDKTTRGIDEWNELRKGNVAVGVVLAAIIVGVGIILRPGLAPAALNLDVGPGNAVVIRLAVQLIQILIGLLLSIVSIGAALWIFTRLTGAIDEWAEIGRGNVAIAIVLAGVVIATALIVSTALDAILLMLVS